MSTNRPGRGYALAAAVAAVLASNSAQAAPAITSVLVTSSAAGTPTSIAINGSGLCATTTVTTCTGTNLPTVTLGGTALTLTGATPTSVTAGIGVLASIPLVARVLFPRLTARIRRTAGKLVEAPRVTRLRIERSTPTAGSEGEAIGFSLTEMAAYSERFLRDIGLISGFARLVFLGCSRTMG